MELRSRKMEIQIMSAATGRLTSFVALLLLSFCFILEAAIVPLFVSPISQTKSSRRVGSTAPRVLVPNYHYTSRHCRSRNDSSSLNSTSSPRICILGGGFAGIHVALTLASLFQHDHTNVAPQITLIDRKERFVFLPLLYELCVGDATLEEVAPTYRTLLEGSQVEFLQGSVQGIDIDARRIYLTHNHLPETIQYDALVLATGADSTDFTQVPGAKDTVVPFYTIEDCYRLRRILDVLESNILTPETTTIPPDPFKIVVVGGGYSGVELSLNVLQRLRKVTRPSNNPRVLQMTLIHRGKEVLEYASEYNRKIGQERLQEAGIQIMTQTSVHSIVPTTSSHHPIISSGQIHVTCSSTDSSIQSSTLDADLILWTAGAMRRNVPHIPGILNSKIPRDTQGRIVTDARLFVRDQSHVLALGDCSRVIRPPTSRHPFPATAQVAMQQATVAAWNLYSTLQGTSDWIPFEYVNLGEMMSLGGEDASISSLQGLVQLDGVSASVLRRWIYALRMPTRSQAWTALLSSVQSRKRNSIV